MAKQQPKNYNVELLQPDEVNELKRLVLEFVKKIESVDSEIETLKQDRKEVYEEYSEKLDTKTLNAALRTLKIKNSIEHRDTFDLFCEVLADPSQ
jgi:uncharacterized protein (UPF0335 family)